MSERGSGGFVIVRILVGVIGFSLALTLGWIAIEGLTRVIPWLRSDNTHITWIVAGMRFSGWGLLVPPFAFAATAVFTFGMTVWVVRGRE